MVQSTFDSVIDQMFSYFNFKIPTSDLNVNITELKSSLLDDFEMHCIEHLRYGLARIYGKEIEESRSKPQFSPCHKKAFDPGMNLRQALNRLKKRRYDP